MRTEEELTSEANRLLALDDFLSEREAVKIALRVGDASEESSRDLARMDRAMLREMLDEDARLVDILDGSVVGTGNDRADTGSSPPSQPLAP